MAQGPTYRVKFRRRREGRTNYYRRRRLLLSRKPRLVVRKTNTKIIVQFTDAKVSGDVTQASAISPELERYGWIVGSKNTPSAYLTGLLAGLRAKARGIDEAILDLGLNPPVKGSKVYAALKGAVDAGVHIPHDSAVLPDDDRVTGNQVVASYEHFTGQETQMFSKIGAKKTTISGIPKKFETVKKALLEIPQADLKKKKKRAAKPKAAEKKPEKKKKKERPAQKAPRAIPRKPKPKKLIARGKGRRGKKKQ